MGVSRSVFGLVLAACLAGALLGCGGARQLSTTAHVAGQTHTVQDPACEQDASNGVHGPDRLKVVNPCATFQGTVSQAPTKNPDDGDVSFNASPDLGYASMLNAQNRREGGLHIEIVPRDQPGCTPGQPVVVGDVPELGTCSGRNLTGPPVGAHVRIVGAWALDRNNDWYEIHPAWKIEILQSPARQSARVVLGRKYLVRHGIGWGRAHPRLLFNGGDPSGRAWHLRWRNWGTATSYARGRTWIPSPKGGYYRKPGAIELRASRVGRCTPRGPLAYTLLRARVAARPGGSPGRWFAWGGWTSTCKGPA